MTVDSSARITDPTAKASSPEPKSYWHAEQQRLAVADRGTVSGLGGVRGTRLATLAGCQLRGDLDGHLTVEVVADHHNLHESAPPDMATRVIYFLPACFRRSAQYFFIRSPTALRASADIFRRFRVPLALPVARPRRGEADNGEKGDGTPRARSALAMRC